MSKQPVKRKGKKPKVIKKTKAKQIIKQKVVVNVGSAASRRRGRPRKKTSSPSHEPVAPGETIKEDRSTQQQYYDQQRASKPYIEELKEEVKLLKGGQDDNMRSLMSMQQAGLMLQMQQNQLNKQLSDRPYQQMQAHHYEPKVTIRPKLQPAPEPADEGGAGAAVVIPPIIKNGWGGRREGSGRKPKPQEPSDASPAVTRSKSKLKKAAVETLAKAIDTS